MIAPHVTLDAEAAKAILEFTTRNMRTGLRRGMDGASNVIMRHTIPLIEREETKPYFQRRRKGLVQDYRRTTRKLRYSWTGQDVVRATTQQPKSDRGKNARVMAAAIELGAPYAYQQFVKEHTRRRTTIFGKPANPYTESVRWFRRYRSERIGKHYLQRGVDINPQEAARPLVRTLEIMMNEKRVPRREELAGA